MKNKQQNQRGTKRSNQLDQELPTQAQLSQSNRQSMGKQNKQQGNSRQTQ
jgi:hypothetical protein